MEWGRGEGGGESGVGVGQELRAGRGLVFLDATVTVGWEIVPSAHAPTPPPTPPCPNAIPSPPFSPTAADTYVLLDLRLLLLLLQDLPVDLLALLAEVLDALDELVVVVLESRTLLRHDRLEECG